MTVDYATGEIVDGLTAMEHSALTHAEAKIEQGLKTFVEVGQALAEIRDARLYRDDHATFEAYCQARWGMDRRNANRTIEAAEVVAGLGSIDPKAPAPENVGQARELVGLAPEPAAEVMRQAHEATDGKVTARSIRDAREAALAKQVEADVEEFPALAHFAEQGEPQRAAAVASNLREFSDEERPRRLEILNKSIEADKRRHLSPVPATPAPKVIADAAEIQDEAVESAASKTIGAVVASARIICAVKFEASEIAPDTDFDDLSTIERAAEFLTDLAAAKREF